MHLQTSRAWFRLDGFPDGEEWLHGFGVMARAPSAREGNVRYTHPLHDYRKAHRHICGTLRLARIRLESLIRILRFSWPFATPSCSTCVLSPRSISNDVMQVLLRKLTHVVPHVHLGCDAAAVLRGLRLRRSVADGHLTSRPHRNALLVTNHGLGLRV